MEAPGENTCRQLPSDGVLDAIPTILIPFHPRVTSSPKKNLPSFQCDPAPDPLQHLVHQLSLAWAVNV